jgi:hypothetical protein
VEKITRDDRQYSEELHDLHSSQYIISSIKSQRMRWVGYVACMGANRNTYGVLVGKHEGEKPLGSPRHRWEHNIKMNLKKCSWKAWTGCVWLRTGAGGRLL